MGEEVYGVVGGRRDCRYARVFGRCFEDWDFVV